MGSSLGKTGRSSFRGSAAFILMPVCVLLLLGLAVMLSRASSGQAGRSGPGPPNVILIVTDDQGYGDCGVHGNQQIDTPNIDRLAREGTEFTRFYVEPVCSPTRASLLTGRYHYRTGVIHTSRGGAKMAGDEVTIAELLSSSGYQTGMFGKWHLGDNFPMRPQDQGFAETLWHKSGGIGQAPDQPNSYFNPLLWRNGKQVRAQGYCTDVFFSAAMDFIAQNRDRPVFVYLATNTPHTPLEVSDEYVDPYRRKGLDERTARVYGMIKNIDDNLGRLDEHLREMGLQENTIVIFISDNGADTLRYSAGLRGRKSSVYEGGIRALCFMRWPGRWGSGTQIDRIAAHIDVLPTLLEACGVTAPSLSRLDGISLAPLLEKDAQTNPWPERRLVIQCHRGLLPRSYQNCAVISGRYKLVGYSGTFPDEALETSRESPRLELYDLETDPGETFDVESRYPQILAELRKEYDVWFSDVERDRHFQAGVIHLGADGENPSLLCRYQDASHHLGLPHGWPVRIERGGLYEIRIKRGRLAGSAHLVLKWKGEEQRKPLEEDRDTGMFELSAGQGILEIWFELDGVGRITFSDNHTIGDVEIRRVGSTN